MPKRLSDNKGLPERWRCRHGAFYYRVPPGLEPMWNGKKEFRLGTTLSEAHKVFGERVDGSDKVHNIGQLLDRYLREVVPGKAPQTQADNQRAIVLLRKRFGEAPLNQPNWPQLFYAYADRRVKPDGTKALTAAHRELEVLSHAFTKAVQWGLMLRHPTYEQVRFDGDLALKPRTRYVEDWEVIEMLSLGSRRRAGSVRMLQAYVRLKLLTGLSRSDLLRLRVDEHIQEDGIHVQRHKTKDSTGKRSIYEWTPDRRAAVEECKRARPALSPFLFCNRRGEGYLNEATGLAHGFDSMWSRFMDRLLAETKITARFTEHDIRRKVGSDQETLERARALLQHADARTTLRFYRAKPERV